MVLGRMNQWLQARSRRLARTFIPVTLVPPPASAESFDQENARINLERLPLGLMVMVVVHALHAIVFLSPGGEPTETAQRWRAAIGLAHLAMLPIAVVGAWVGRKLRRNAARWWPAPLVIATLYLMFAAVVTGIDQIAVPTPIAYVMSAIGLALFLRYSFAESVIVFALGLVAMFIAAEAFQPEPSLRSSLEMNSLTATAIAFLIARSNARLHRRIWDDRRLIMHQASTDPLTGILTRGAFLAQLERIATACRPAALALIDIDELKAINDRRGHAAGDAAIIAVAGAVKGAIRGIDVLGRLGGDELCVILRDVDGERASLVGERIRASTERTGVTVSIGIALSVANEPPDRWLARADAAMYRAKNEGRNQVRRASQVA